MLRVFLETNIKEVTTDRHNEIATCSVAWLRLIIRTAELLFRTCLQDCSSATPATISRCGMLYLDEEPLTWRILVTTWIKTLPEAINRSLREIMSQMFFRYYTTTYKKIFRNVYSVGQKICGTSCQITPKTSFCFIQYFKETDRQTFICILFDYLTIEPKTSICLYRICGILLSN